MSTLSQFELVPDQQLIKICQQGPLSRRDIKATRADTRDLYLPFNICKALVDYRQADLSRLNLIELDDLAEEFRSDLPHCRHMALVHSQNTPDLRALHHIKQVCLIKGVNTELFESMEQAQQWLARCEAN